MPRRGSAEVALLQRVIFNAVWGIVWEALARYHLSRADREDVTQETLLRMWRKRGRYRGDRGSPEAWIRSIARTTAIDFLRKNGAPVPDDHLVTVASDARNPEQTVMWSQLAALADHVLEGIPEKERRVLILRELEGHTFPEIAKIENISPATAHARHARGMEKLKKAKEDGALDVLMVPVVDTSDDPPTPEMRDRAWQRFVDAGGLDLPADSEPPPSGTRRTGTPTKLRKLGPLMAIFLGPGLTEPHGGDPPATAAMVAVVALAAPQIATTPTVTMTVQKPATTTMPPGRARPLGQVDREHVIGGAVTRDRLRETASQ